MKYQKFSHKTPHLKGKQHQLDPNLDLKQLVHHATVQYVDRDADGDVDVFDNPKKKTPDENPVGVNVGDLSKKLIAKQKGELKHTKRGMAYEGNLHKWFKSSKSKDGKPGWVNVVTGGTCASDEPGEGVPKCVSSEKRASMTPAERLSAARRKKKADPRQQEKTGAAKPTYVSTDKPKKMKEEKQERRYCIKCKKMETRDECSYGPEMWDKMTVKGVSEAVKKDHEYSMARSQLSTVMSAANRLKKKMAKGEGEIEAWVQSKITKAADYLDAAADYIDSGEHDIGEEKTKCPEGQYFCNRENKCKPIPKGYHLMPNGAIMKDDEHDIEEAKGPCWDGYKQVGMKKKGNRMVPNCVPEETVSEADVKGKGSGKKDACYKKVKSRYSVWPSAYASGALVKCRKVGAANWGNKSESISIEDANGNLQAEFIDIITPDPLQPSKGIGSDMIGEAGDYWHPDPKEDKKLSNRGAKLRAREDRTTTSTSSDSSDKRKLRPGESYLEYSRRVSGSKPPVKQKERKRERIVRVLGKAIDRIGGLNKEETEILEAVRIPAKSGNLLFVSLTWKGKYYGIKMFFPQSKLPNRREVQDQIDKVYPGARVYSFQVSEYEPGQPFLQVAEGAAWTRKEGQSKSGGLNEKGRKSYERENPGSDLKAPSKKVGNPRRASFCARMKGMKSKLTSAKTANDPNSRINKSLRAWNC